MLEKPAEIGVLVVDDVAAVVVREAEVGRMLVVVVQELDGERMAVALRTAFDRMDAVAAGRKAVADVVR